MNANGGGNVQVLTREDALTREGTLSPQPGVRAAPWDAPGQPAACAEPGGRGQWERWGQREGWGGLTRIRQFVVSGAEPCLALPVVAAVHRFGLLGVWPLWAWVVLLFVNAVVQQPGVHRWLGGGDLRGRVWLRLALHFGVVTVAMYVAGGGALISVAYLIALSVQMRWSGARVWRAAAVWSATGIGCGEMAVALGWLPSYVPEPQVHGVATLCALGTVLTCRLLGQAAEQREEAEAAVRRSSERFRALVQDSSDVIAVGDPSGQVSYVSPAADRVMGYSPEQLCGTSYAGWIHPEDLASAESLWAGVLTDDGAERRTELRVRHADGNWRWHEVTGRNLLGNPAVQGIVASHRDVTERRAIQELRAYDASHD